jgi:hypothetical protein
VNGGTMQKCNDFVTKQYQESKCNPSDPNSRTDFWLVTRIEAKSNGMICLDFYCKHCNKRTFSFLTQEEYAANRRILGV